MENQHIVIFDGVCNFCNGAVNFIIKRDPDAHFLFTPMQSDLAHELMKKHGMDMLNLDTIVLIKYDQCFVFSSAALEITKDLSGFWYLFSLFKFVPSPIMDFCYKSFARNRYRFFGRNDACMIPTKEVKSRFLGI